MTKAPLNFNSTANFRGARFRNKVYFVSSTINGIVDFRKAQLDSLVDFSLATVKNTLFIGTPKSTDIQKYDFMRTNLLPPDEEVVREDTLKNDGVSRGPSFFYLDR